MRIAALERLLIDSDDVATIIDALSSLPLSPSLYRGFAAAFARDVLFIDDDVTTARAIEASSAFGRGCIGVEALSAAHCRLTGRTRELRGHGASLARAAARIASSPAKATTATANAARAAAESAFLASGARLTTTSVRQHQADVARAFLTPRLLADASRK